MKAFGSYHPLVLLIYFLSVLLVAMFVFHPAAALTALAGSILFCFFLTSRKERRADLLFYLPLFFLIALVNPLFSHNGATPLFFMNGNAVTLEAILYGIALAVMLVAVMLWCKCYSRIMTADKFIFLFGRPLPKLSLILSMALRFIPMFKRQAEKVRRAQKAMGLYSSGSYTDRIRASARVMSVVIGWAMENAVETSASMKARGYGLKHRTHYSTFRFTGRDAAMLLWCALLLVSAGFGIASGALAFSYYPEVSGLSADPTALAAYIAYALLCFLPFTIELEETIRWNYYRSKI